MRKSFLLSLIVMSVSLASNAATIKVKISGVQKNSGNVVVGLFSGTKSTAFPNGEPITRKQVPAKDTVVNINFEGVEPGTYAIGVYNDINKNNKLDKVLGIPKEQYGNSGKRTNMEPVFVKSKFDVGSEDKQIEIDVH